MSYAIFVIVLILGLAAWYGGLIMEALNEPG